jgi:tetratricopeptide (TPR) repeat protein
MDRQQNARISVLLQQSRYADAEAALRDVLAQNPDNPQALLLMAVVLNQMDRDEDALGAINVALRMEPESDRIHAWKSRILLALNRPSDAMASAERALGLDGQDPFNWTAKAAIHATRRQWKDCEADCRSALTLDPDDQNAHHLLSQSLLYQGKARENEGNIASRLADDPENPIAHCNAGFAALRRGDHRIASEHFAAALRLDASSQMARDGLIESFRARSAFYRMYLGFAFRVAKLSEKMGPVLFIGIYLVYRFVREALGKIDSRLATGFVVFYLTFVFWTYVARGLSTFFLLTDRFARHALRATEKWEALIVGGGFASGFVLLVIAFCTDNPELLITGGALLGQSIPAAVFFDRSSRAGRWLYGSLATITWVCATIVVFDVWTGLVPDSIGTAALLTGLWTIAGTTFLAMFGVAKR